MPATKKAPGEKKRTVAALVQEKKVDLLTYQIAKEIAEKAINLAYDKKVSFKNKYFSNNFYWVNKENFEQLQNIGVEMGCVNPSGDTSIINWHDGFSNLGFRTKDGLTKFQKEPFLLENESATNYDEMIIEYNNLT